MQFMDVSLSLNLVEDMFRKSRKTIEFNVCSSLVLEIKTSMESYISDRLVRGHKISLRQAFTHCCEELVSEEEDWMLD